MAKPDVLAEIEAIRERGGKVVVVDPRRTRTADVADEWIGIQPGTDAAWLLAVVNEFFANGWIHLGHLADIVADLDELRRRVRRLHAESVAALTRVPADVTRRIAGEIHAASAASVYGRIGLCNQEFGTLASWLIDVLAIISGNFDRPGTLMFANPFGRRSDWMRARGSTGFPSSAAGSRGCAVRQRCSDRFRHRAWPRRSPPRPGQIKGLINVAATPGALRAGLGPPRGRAPPVGVHDRDRPTTSTRPPATPTSSSPGHRRSRLHTSTSCCGASPPARPASGASRSSRSTAPTSGRSSSVSPDHGRQARCRHRCRRDRRCLVHDAVHAKGPRPGRDPAALRTRRRQGRRAGADDRLVDPGRPFGDMYGRREGLTLADFKANPTASTAGRRSLGPTTRCAHGRSDPPRARVPLSDLPRLRERIGAPVDGLVLVSRAARALQELVAAQRARAGQGQGAVHADDQPRRCGAPRRERRVAGADQLHRGSILVQAEVTDEMLSGIVSLPHGWATTKAGTRLSIAREHAGVNNKPARPGEFVDALSGNAAVNGIPVEVVLPNRPRSSTLCARFYANVAI